MSLMLTVKYSLLLIVAVLMLLINIKLLARFVKVKLATSKIFLRQKEFLDVVLGFFVALLFLLTATSSFCISTFLKENTIKTVGIIFANLTALTLLHTFYRFYRMVR